MSDIGHLRNNPTPLADSAELRKQIIDSLSRAQLEQPDAQGEAVIESEADLLIYVFTQHHQALIQKIEEAMPKKEANAEYDSEIARNQVIDEFTDILNQAGEGKLWTNQPPKPK